jgi:hypothetical protein
MQALLFPMTRRDRIARARRLRAVAKRIEARADLLLTRHTLTELLLISQTIREDAVELTFLAADLLEEAETEEPTGE